MFYVIHILYFSFFEDFIFYHKLIQRIIKKLKFIFAIDINNHTKLFSVKKHLYDMLTYTKITRLCKAASMVVILTVFLFFAKSTEAAQTLLQVKIPPRVIVDVERQNITAIYSNLGRVPNIEEIIWRNKKQMITADDALIQKFMAISLKLDWQKAGIIYKRETIWEKIVSLLS